jgi:hypothetical protein
VHRERNCFMGNASLGGVEPETSGTEGGGLGKERGAAASVRLLCVVGLWGCRPALCRNDATPPAIGSQAAPPHPRQAQSIKKARKSAAPPAREK